MSDWELCPCFVRNDAVPDCALLFKLDFVFPFGFALFLGSVLDEGFAILLQSYDSLRSMTTAKSLLIFLRVGLKNFPMLDSLKRSRQSSSNATFSGCPGYTTGIAIGKWSIDFQTIFRGALVASSSDSLGIASVGSSLRRFRLLFTLAVCLLASLPSLVRFLFFGATSS